MRATTQSTECSRGKNTMSIFDKVRRAKDEFKNRYDQRQIQNEYRRQERETQEKTRSVQARLDLESARSRRTALQEHAATKSALSAENRKIRELNHPILFKAAQAIQQSPGPNKTKSRGSGVMAALKKSAEETRNAARQTNSRPFTQGSISQQSPFGNESLGNSPFHPTNLAKQHKNSGATINRR